MQVEATLWVTSNNVITESKQALICLRSIFSPKLKVVNFEGKYKQRTIVQPFNWICTHLATFERKIRCCLWWRGAPRGFFASSQSTDLSGLSL